MAGKKFLNRSGGMQMVVKIRPRDPENSHPRLVRNPRWAQGTEKKNAPKKRDEGSLRTAVLTRTHRKEGENRSQNKGEIRDVVVVDGEKECTRKAGKELWGKDPIRGNLFRGSLQEPERTKNACIAAGGGGGGG